MAADWVYKRSVPALFLAICLLALCVGQAGARSPGTNDIQPYDTIFVYEEGLDLTQLRNATTGNPVTALRQYQDDNPERSLIRSIPVIDDTDFDLSAFQVSGEYGTYFAFNPADGATEQVFVREPQIFLDVVLASPYHNEPLEGLTISETTQIAFRITSPDVGAFYHAGGTYPATVDLLITSPGGAESTIIGGRQMSGLNISAPQFYTDDAGRPGPISLAGLQEGTYTVRAQWSQPRSFADNADDSNAVTFSVGRRVGVETGTPTPVVTTPLPTTVPPTPAPTEETPVPTTVPATETTTPAVTTAPTTVETTEPTPTPAPLPLWTGIGAIAAAILLIGRRR